MTWYEQYLKPAIEELNQYDFSDLLDDCDCEGLNEIRDIFAEIEEQYPELAEAWNANLKKTSMHPGSLHIMKTDEWKEYSSAVSKILEGRLACELF